MARDGNYAAFYVKEPFDDSDLAQHATADFLYYNLLRTWKGADSSFPFVNSHDKTYNVRDGSSWEQTLKPRLRERLRSSKNLILFLSSNTVNSLALGEEIEYGVGDQKLPVIVVYPEYKTKESLLKEGVLADDVKKLWSKVPPFKKLMVNIPTLHISLNKSDITSALKNTDFTFGTEKEPDYYYYT